MTNLCIQGLTGPPTAVDLGELDVTTEFDCIMDRDCGGDGAEGKKCLDEGLCGEKAVRYLVEAVKLHPKYTNSDRSTFDVAILVLDRSASFNTYIQPVCLPSPETATTSFDFPNQQMVVKGWGNVVLGNRQPQSATVLQELRGLKEIPLEDEGSNTGCKTRLGPFVQLDSYHMCVSRKDGSEEPANACKGDSGGPVSRLHRTSVTDVGHWELAGVVSFGVTRACGSRHPLIVTRVADPEILNFIRDEINSNLLEK